jgi:hypothetical protein
VCESKSHRALLSTSLCSRCKGSSKLFVGFCWPLSRACSVAVPPFNCAVRACRLCWSHFSLAFFNEPASMLLGAGPVCGTPTPLLGVHHFAARWHAWAPHHAATLAWCNADFDDVMVSRLRPGWAGLRPTIGRPLRWLGCLVEQGEGVHIRGGVLLAPWRSLLSAGI